MQACIYSGLCQVATCTFFGFRILKKKVCSHGRLRSNKSVTVWAYKTRMPHTDALVPMLHKSFFFKILKFRKNGNGYLTQIFANEENNYPIQGEKAVLK